MSLLCPNSLIPEFQILGTLGILEHFRCRVGAAFYDFNGLNDLNGL